MSVGKLHNHGIQTERSDIRAHVGVLSRNVYVFRTDEAVALAASGKYTERPATQPGVDGITAMGFAVPLEDFTDLRVLPCRRWPRWVEFRQDLPTTEKGRLAVALVCDLLARGRFPLWIIASETKLRDVQISGTDIVVFAKQRIQVKCDYRAGRVTDCPSCTGRLYLQTAERNPLGLH